MSISARTVMAIVNAHGGDHVLSNIAQQADLDGPRIVLFPNRTDWDTAREDAGMVTSTSEDMYADELETSLLLHAYPDLVGDAHTVRITSPTPDHTCSSPAYAATPIPASSADPPSPRPPGAGPYWTASPRCSPATSRS